MAEKQFTIRRKVFAFLGKKFHIYYPDGSLMGFCKQKAFKLKEDIRVYDDESMASERLIIQARSIIDFSAAYNVIDGETHQQIGALRRKGWKSIIRDEWEVLDNQDREIGKIHEDSTMLALVRRFLTALVPQTFHLRDNSGNELAELRTHFNPFIYRMTVTISENCSIHPYLVLAAGVLLAAIEGREG